MSFLTNKHFVIALIVAPILAVIAYFAVDRAVTEPPQQAVAGQDYPLVAASNCRYSSGRCTMKNGNFNVTITPEFEAANLLRLHLQSAFPVTKVSLALVPNAEANYPPLEMEQVEGDAQSWVITTTLPESENPLLRLVVEAEGSRYFGETGLAFRDYETSYHEDFRK
ncbi:hypothetical protein IB286_07930 [Spongiibacter sp. KMU-158]|uniref:Uncharacterized protein n=1 Tax=Spongiibacter pelagi TaxID=2760804 RepID=A0A927C3H2_9GAMM|nr:hypothetical protein [Spongiibacter pelagi]MBD2858941.1 hypothetical protein [Spongiibacter pelagi]